MLENLLQIFVFFIELYGKKAENNSARILKSIHRLHNEFWLSSLGYL